MMEESSMQQDSGSAGIKNRDKCAYCGISRAANPSRKYFKFPKDPIRCQLWVSRCKKPYLEKKSLHQLHTSHKLCSDHFQEDDFVMPSKHRLKCTAIPVFNCNPSQQATDAGVKTLDVSELKLKLLEKMSVSADAESHSLMVHQFYEEPVSVSEDGACENELPESSHLCVPSISDMSIAEVASPIICSTPKRSSIRTRKFTPKTQKIRNLSSKVYFLKQKLTRGLTNPSAVMKYVKESVPPEIYSFILTQINAAKVSKFARRWKVKDKELALKLYLASPKAYNIFVKHFFFPSKRTVLKSIDGLDVEPGFCTPVLKALRIITKKMQERDRYCSISLDEMKLKKGLSYNKKLDAVIGFENYGQHTPPDPKLATHALVFMVRGICRKWKQAFGAFFSTNTTKSAILKQLVLEAVELIKCSGLIPVTIVCDQGANNLKLYQTEFGVSEEKPFFMASGLKIYAIHDPPHLLKCLRNNFKNYPVRFFDIKEQIHKLAEWSHIRLLYDFEKDKPHRAAKKLTAKHLEVDGLSKMNVALAAQIFSNSVAAGLAYLSYMPNMPSTAVHTADFVAQINYLFDSVNSRVLQHKTNQYLSACSKTSIHDQYWEEMIKFLHGVEYETGEKNVKFYCISGWIQTLSAFRMMTKELLEEIPFILMSRFSQDALENLFSQVRRKGGFDDHPTPMDFMFRMRQVIAQNVISTCENTNCEADKDEVLVPLEILTSFKAQGKSPAREDDTFNDVVEGILCNSDTENVDDPDMYNLNVSAYIAGYIAKKLFKKYDCNLCRSNLADEGKALSQSTRFIYLKEYENTITGLCYPQETFSNLIMTFGDKFSDLFKYMSHKCNISKIIMSELSKHDFSFLTCIVHKQNLQEDITKLYTNLMLFSEVKKISKSINNSKKRKSKVKKLK